MDHLPSKPLTESLNWREPMTEFFAYDELTWPEIYKLSRTTPLVIPLGFGYDQERLADALGYPSQAGMLPAVPYGWPGSGLEVPQPILGAFLRNLVGGLQDDGFTRVCVLTPQQTELGAYLPQISLSHPSQFAPDSSLPDESQRGKVILIPVGHTEQHGFHSPMSTDTLIIEAVSQGAAEAASDKAYCLPVMPYGVSTHRASFAGTLNAGGRAFEDFYIALIDALAWRGFDRFYLMSGHGGNSSFLVNVVKYAGERHRRIFCATAWLYLSGHSGVAALEQYRSSPIGGMGHACELETSLILHLGPELIHMDRAVDEMEYIATPDYYMDWVEGGALVANPPWDDDTRTGAYGAGSLGTAEKGKLWLAAAISEKVSHVHEIHLQHQRREERRNSGYGLWSGSVTLPQDSK
jgi:creatinine amidohydrolase